MAVAKQQLKTGNEEVDGLLSGSRWEGLVSYGFPDSPSDYGAGYGPEPGSDFFAISAEQQRVVRTVLGSVESYTNLRFSYAGTKAADISFGQSSVPDTATGAYPADGGDVWFGSATNFRTPRVGSYAYQTHIHEIGHALGLKHSQEYGGPADTPLAAHRDWLGYSAMSYRSYEEAPTTGYSNETFGYPTTFMANDILALQTMYGANYATNNGNTVYSWSPLTGQQFVNGVGQAVPGSGGGVAGDPSSNRIFMTVWDGGGIDTFDLSNYSSNQSVNLLPGEGSDFYGVQKANLGSGRSAHNVYNSYLFKGDARSLIENVKTGSGNDSIRGNQANNLIDAGAGDDSLYGFSGNDRLTGGVGHDYLYGATGADVAVFNCKFSQAAIWFLDDGTCIVAGPDGVDRLFLVEQLQFSDVIVSVANLKPGDATAPSLKPVPDNVVLSGQYNSVLLQFDEPVQLGTGSLRIYYEDGTLYRTLKISPDGYAESLAGVPYRTGQPMVLSSDGMSIRFHYPADPGSYYVELDRGLVLDAAGNPFAGVSGPYRWNFSVGRADDFPNEFNSFTAGALTVGALPTVGYLNDLSDSDNFKVNLVAGQLYQFIVTTPGPNPASADWFRISLGYALYDEPWAGVEPSSSSNGQESIFFLAPKSGEYRFTVNPGDIDPRAGDYQVQVKTAADDFADSAASRAILAAGKSVSGIIHHAADSDWLRVDMIAGRTYRFDATMGSAKLPKSAIDALQLEVIDSSGQLVGTSFDHPQLLYTATASGTYYLKVSGAPTDPYRDLSNTGSYTVSLKQGAFAPPQLVSTTPANGATGLGSEVRFVFTFDEAILAGEGQIVVQRLKGSYYPEDSYWYVYEIIDVNDASRVTISGSTLTVVLREQTEEGGQYSVGLSWGAVTDLQGNAYNGSGGANFTRAFDADHSVTTPLSIAPGETVSARINGTSDSDWYRVNLVAGEKYSFTMIALSSFGPQLPGGGEYSSSSSIAVRNASGNVIVQDAANSIGGLNARVVFTAPTTGVYFIDVTGTFSASAQQGFAYRLEAGGAPGVVRKGTAAAETLTGTRDNDVLQGFAGNDTIDGKEHEDVISGGIGDDILVGGTGTDRMAGEAGNDIYYVDRSSDLVIEARLEGTDLVRSSASYELAANVENLVLIGTAPIAGTGNGLDNAITGNGAANVLDGGAGNDTLDGRGAADLMKGGAGNDIYLIDNPLDAIEETLTAGSVADAARSSVSYTLGSGVRVETLATNNAAGTKAINLTGNSYGNSVVGNNGANTLLGKAGNDALQGGGGIDRLEGGVGSDNLYGGAGSDVLRGDDAGTRGLDRFFFDTALSASANVDRIEDFNVADDSIQLKKSIFAGISATGVLRAAEFVKIANYNPAAPPARTAVTDDHHIIYDPVAGKIYYDADGAGGSVKALLFATVTPGLALTSADFIVY